MHYQPIVDADGRVVGVEALARCRDTYGQMIEPAGFLDAIDGTNLIVRLDHAGFEQTCDLAATLAADPATSNLYVSANFSAMTIAQNGFAAAVKATIARSGAPATSLCVEVTETAAFDAGQSSIDRLRELHLAGVRIALDDFGTAYSSLSHLRDLPLSSVKIDRTFTMALSQTGPERAIASAVKELAESLGLNVVAEGAETEADRQAVSEIGVTSMQGWLFDRALTSADLMDKLKNERAVAAARHSSAASQLAWVGARFATTRDRADRGRWLPCRGRDRRCDRRWRCTTTRSHCVAAVPLD